MQNIEGSGFTGEAVKGAEQSHEKMLPIPKIVLHFPPLQSVSYSHFAHCVQSIALEIDGLKVGIKGVEVTCSHLQNLPSGKPKKLKQFPPLQSALVSHLFPFTHLISLVNNGVDLKVVDKGFVKGLMLHEQSFPEPPGRNSGRQIPPLQSESD